jgi:hypothetical protein
MLDGAHEYDLCIVKEKCIIFEIIYYLFLDIEYIRLTLMNNSLFLSVFVVVFVGIYITIVLIFFKET